jgi:23S rRNA (pseudouridine1915-N3)-methyltransferase
MKVTVLAVGRLKAGPEWRLAEEYRERAAGLGRSAGITRLTLADVSESKARTAPRRMAEEARFLAGGLPAGAFTVVLDERGEGMTSPAFASLLRRHADGGTADMAFLIGGPDGLDPTVRDKAGLLLSFGPMTWPHRLVRVMVLEQIYRAVTIMVNHPYHRS